MLIQIRMLQLILLTSFASLGFFIACQKPFILYEVRDWLGDNIGGVKKYNGTEEYYQFNSFLDYLWMPIIGCPICMSSAWSILIYSLFSSYTQQSWHEVPVLILCSCCLNFVIFNNLIKKHIFG